MVATIEVRNDIPRRSLVLGKEIEARGGDNILVCLMSALIEEEEKETLSSPAAECTSHKADGIQLLGIFMSQ